MSVHIHVHVFSSAFFGHFTSAFELSVVKCVCIQLRKVFRPKRIVISVYCHFLLWFCTKIDATGYMLHSNELYYVHVHMYNVPLH